MDAGRNLKLAIDLSANDTFLVRLNTAVDPMDAHAIDVLYHRNCWSSNVNNVIRPNNTQQFKSQKTAALIAAEIEFVILVENLLNEGKILDMSQLEKTFITVNESNGVDCPTTSHYVRKNIKELLQKEIPEIEFNKPGKVNEAERVSIKFTRDNVIYNAQVHQIHAHDNMKEIYDVARLLRKLILDTTPWTFKGSLTDTDIIGENVPHELYSFFRWLTSGPEVELASESRSKAINRNALALSQSTMYSCLSERQRKLSKEETNTRHIKEWPLQLAVGIAVHQSTRSKKLIDLLHSFSLSVDYKRIIRLENMIGNEVIKQMELNNGFYVPQNFVKGKHIFFAIDNCDFSEDTPDGKRTLHGTVMAMYQETSTETENTKLVVNPDTNCYKLDKLPESMTDILPCYVPADSKPLNPTYSAYDRFMYETTSPIQPFLFDDLTWLIGKTLHTDTESQEENRSQLISSIPTWTAYNSLVTESLHLTAIGTPPLLPHPAHEYSTLFTVLTQAQNINTFVVGQNRKTVITLDLGLYKPAKKLEMVKESLHDKFILRAGELHIVMAMLRSIGSYVENSGIDMAWVEAGMYGETTSKQIIDGGHVKRGIEAHTVTLIVLFDMYIESLLEKKTCLRGDLSEKANRLVRSFKSKLDIKETHKAVVAELKASNVNSTFKEHDDSCIENPMFVAVRQYMEMVLTMLQFIRAYHTGNWRLHLSSLEAFTKFFFSLDKLNYARLMPLYISEMLSLETTDPDIWEEFVKGNWVVNKNVIPFCAIGADHALEHINRWMKVSGGIIGITLNDVARARFFLVSPHLSVLVNETNEMAGNITTAQTAHHENNKPTLTRQNKNVRNLSDVIKNCGNPFQHNSLDIINIVTKQIMPTHTKNDILTLGEKGSRVLEKFVNERIRTNDVNLWAVLKKSKLSLWKDNVKKVKVKDKGVVVELREDRGLFARLLIASRTRPEINLQEILSEYELSVVPRSLFATDGSLLHCSSKSQLMSLLESVQSPVGENETAAIPNIPVTIQANSKSTVVVDGMVEVQSMGKPHWVRTCLDLATHFISIITKKFISRYDEIHLIFDRYDIDKSLKTSTRNTRLGKTVAVAYHITDSTNIGNVTMKKLLSHSSTKHELTEYFSKKILDMAKDISTTIVCAWSNKAESNTFDASYLGSSQEEADTKLVLHGVEATKRGASQLSIYSLDTDVFVLCLRRCPLFPKTVTFCTGVGNRYREIDMQNIFVRVSPLNCKALPGLHSFSGADITGSMSGKGKASFWKTFSSMPDDIKSAFVDLGKTESISDNLFQKLELYVCQLYCPKTSITDIGKLRWFLFKQKQAESEKLPPTKSALRQMVLRAHYQALIWECDIIANPQIPPPTDYGWEMKDGMYEPMMTLMPPAPAAIIYLVHCNCKVSRCMSMQCKCKHSGLVCTELCNCSIDDECENNVITNFVGDDA